MASEAWASSSPLSPQSSGVVATHTAASAGQDNRVKPDDVAGESFVLCCDALHVGWSLWIEAFLQLLCFTRRYVKPRQRILLYCFTTEKPICSGQIADGISQYLRWLHHLDQALSPNQVKALKLQENQLLHKSVPFTLWWASKEFLQVCRVYGLTESNAHHAYRGDKAHCSVAVLEAVFSIRLLANGILVKEFSFNLSNVLVGYPG